DVVGNRNVIVHGHADTWPWHGVTLAAHMIRLLSLLMGAATVLCAYGTAQAAFPGQQTIAATAAALVAFNPQFLFLSAAVNNDNLVVMCSAMVIWLLTRAVAEESIKEQQLMLLGGLIGAAALSKLSGLLLIVPAGCVLVYLAWRRHSSRDLLRWGIIMGSAALAVGGWWYARNWLLYGDPLGLRAMFAVLPRRPEPPTWHEILARLPGVWRSYWAVFGWFNVIADPWLYYVYTTLSLFGLVGLAAITLRVLIRHSVGQTTQLPLHPLILLTTWIALAVVGLLYWARMRYPQGRLLFPAITSAAVLLSVGLHAWLPRRWHATGATMLVIGLFGLAALAPWRWIAPAYAPPPLLPADTDAPNPILVAFDGQIALVGYELEAVSLKPGDTLPVTLYWQALRTPEQDYSVFVHLTDETGILQAQHDTYPANGALPTTEWPLNRIIPDRHIIRIPETAPAPVRLRVDVGLYEFATDARLYTAHGDHYTLGYVTLLPRTRENGVPNPVFINFDDQIALVGFELDRRVMQPGGTLTVRLWWKALREPRANYVVFTHLVLPPSAVWAQMDSVPQQGAAPTSTWRRGQRIEDTYRLTLPTNAPTGIYLVEVGVYDPRTMKRLKVNLSDKGIVLGQVKVVKQLPYVAP
ncbi:MAG: glycosyltransferase family 39 protein, partial [Anaerolineae bacterium]|nr:glycosyltransferase family 39 protein [Anaerolineae bacterium]